jgi:hypothetical protein
MLVAAIGASSIVPLVVEIDVNAPVEGVVLPIALLSMVAPVNAPAEIVLPEKSNAAARFSVTAGDPVAVIAPAVPVIDVIGAVPLAADVT